MFRNFMNMIKKSNNLDKDEIAELLKVNPALLEDFEQAYNSIEDTSDNFFDKNAKQAVQENKDKEIKSDKDISYLTNKIVDELLTEANISDKVESNKPNNYVKPDEVNMIPSHIRPQLTGKLMQVDIDIPSYYTVIDYYKKWQDTGNTSFYHKFRQGLDILDLDPIIYEMIGKNKNSMSYWFPEIKKSAEITNFFKVPKTKIVKIPLPLLQLTRLNYMDLTPSTLKIVNDFCMKAFDLDVNKKYFIKTGTYSSKFDFRNAVVHGEQEVRELGEYLLFIHFQALQMASPLSSPSIYGVSTTNEWVVREYIEDVENNPTIYKGHCILNIDSLWT